LHKPKQAIVFTNFKNNVERVAQFLIDNGVPAVPISSLLSQSQRNKVMELFKASDNQYNILVATDVAARGLDIKGVDMVVNFELPQDSESYVHRIGRTGRAGQMGQAFSLVSDRDVDSLQRIEEYLQQKISVGFLDDSQVIKEFKAFPDFVKFNQTFGFLKTTGDKRPSRDNGKRERSRPHRQHLEKNSGGRGDHGRGESARRSEGRFSASHGENSQNAKPNRSHERHAQGEGGRSEHQRRGHSKDQAQKPHASANGRGHSASNPRKQSSVNPRKPQQHHRPGKSHPVVAKKTVVQKVSQFFKKLFS
jgi:ATP-dependent RNA helicase RhlB